MLRKINWLTPFQRKLADEVGCLETRASFQAVGPFNRHFAQVDDAEVIELLRGVNRPDSG